MFEVLKCGVYAVCLDGGYPVWVNCNVRKYF
jgi:hypothetical protein